MLPGDFDDFYAILGINQDATPIEREYLNGRAYGQVTRKWIEFAICYHPSHVYKRENGAELYPLAVERYKLIASGYAILPQLTVAAYNTLMDPDLRRDHDALRRGRAASNHRPGRNLVQEQFRNGLLTIPTLMEIPTEDFIRHHEDVRDSAIDLADWFEDVYESDGWTTLPRYPTRAGHSDEVKKIREYNLLSLKRIELGATLLDGLAKRVLQSVFALKRAQTKQSEEALFPTSPLSIIRAKLLKHHQPPGWDVPLRAGIILPSMLETQDIRTIMEQLFPREAINYAAKQAGMASEGGFDEATWYAYPLCLVTPPRRMTLAFCQALLSFRREDQLALSPPSPPPKDDLSQANGSGPETQLVAVAPLAPVVLQLPTTATSPGASRHAITTIPEEKGTTKSKEETPSACSGCTPSTVVPSTVQPAQSSLVGAAPTSRRSYSITSVTSSLGSRLADATSPAPLVKQSVKPKAQSRFSGLCCVSATSLNDVPPPQNSEVHLNPPPRRNEDLSAPKIGKPAPAFIQDFISRWAETVHADPSDYQFRIIPRHSLPEGSISRGYGVYCSNTLVWRAYNGPRKERYLVAHELFLRTSAEIAKYIREYDAKTVHKQWTRVARGFHSKLPIEDMPADDILTSEYILDQWSIKLLEERLGDWSDSDSVDEESIAEPLELPVKTTSATPKTPTKKSNAFTRLLEIWRGRETESKQEIHEPAIVEKVGEVLVTFSSPPLGTSELPLVHANTKTLLQSQTRSRRIVPQRTSSLKMRSRLLRSLTPMPLLRRGAPHACRGVSLCPLSRTLRLQITRPRQLLTVCQSLTS